MMQLFFLCQRGCLRSLYEEATRICSSLFSLQGWFVCHIFRPGLYQEGISCFFPGEFVICPERNRTARERTGEATGPVLGKDSSAGEDVRAWILLVGQLG